MDVLECLRKDVRAAPAEDPELLIIIAGIIIAGINAINK